MQGNTYILVLDFLYKRFDKISLYRYTSLMKNSPSTHLDISERSVAEFEQEFQTILHTITQMKGIDFQIATNNQNIARMQHGKSTIFSIPNLPIAISLSSSKNKEVISSSTKDIFSKSSSMRSVTWWNTDNSKLIKNISDTSQTSLHQARFHFCLSIQT